MLKTLLFIGMGSFTGGVLRYLISRYVQNFLIPSFLPFGNVSGQYTRLFCHRSVLWTLRTGKSDEPQSENVSHGRILWRIHHLFNLHE